MIYFKYSNRIWMLLMACIMSCVAIAQDENYGIGDGFDPANPGNPGSNGWNAATGEVIIDDFTTGNLNNSITKIIGNSGSAAVTQIVVAGVINNTDFRVGNNYANSTLVDFSRTAGINSVPSSAYSGNTHLCSIMLPTSITDIGSNAFNGCSALTAMTCYTLTPPKVGANAFSGVADGMVVYVPSEAVDRYIEADIWKDFTILPIQETVHSLTVKLPNDIDISTFKNMTLELVNAKSGQSYRYIITEKTSYVFNNLIENTVYKAYVKNNQNNIFGETSEISVNDTDAEVTFASLSIPQNINLSIMAGGNDITSQSTVIWTDSLGNYLSQGASLSGYAIGKKLNYSIVLPQNIVMEYALPNTMQHVVAVGGNNIVCTLSPLQKVVITGKVLALTTKSAISGAVVSASQTFGGKYSKTTNVKTNNNGEYSIEIFRVPTSLAIAASDYVSQTVECDVVNAEGDNVSVSDVSLKSITGAVISLDFTYTKCPDNEGEEGDVESYYSEYTNVDYTIFNKTQNRNVSQFNVQYPQIVLLEEVNENDVLELTASSRTSAFVPVKATATIDAEQHANVTFDIVELGKLKSSFAANGNSSVVGSLYDANGKLLKTYDYSGNSLTVSALADGNYTLVTMGSSRLFNTIYDLSQLPQTGLTKDVDYAQNNVTIESGKLTVISIAEVPTLDESKLYYTGENTSFTVNKPSIVAGNYLTLTGHLDFKSAYSTKVSNVNLIVDLPESCSFVENSVMVGNSTSSYTLNGNRLTIPMSRYTDRVRFCIIPTLGGDYAPSALAQFDIDGESITQPIGYVDFTVKNHSISIPSTVSKTTVPISGTASGKSSVEIFDGGTLIGQTTATTNGLWSTTVELDKPYNLSTHSIFAKITSLKGLEMYTETKDVIYNMDCIEAKTVTMSFYNGWLKKNIDVTFDLKNKTSNVDSYMFYTTTDITFVADLTNNDTTSIHNVTIRVYTDKKNWYNLPASYDKNLNRWIAVHKFGSYELPVGVMVDFVANNNYKADRNQIQDDLASCNDDYIASWQEREELEKDIDITLPNQSVYDNIFNILSSDSIDISKLHEELYKITTPGDSVDYDTDALCSSVDELFKSIEGLDSESNEEFASLLNDWYTQKDELANSTTDFESSLEAILGRKIISKTKLLSIDVDELEKDGYDKIQLTDSSFVFIKVDSISHTIIDSNTSYKYEVRLVYDNDSIINYSKGIGRNLQDCVTGFKMAVIQLQKTIEASKETKDEGKVRHYIAVFSSVIKEIGNLLECVYENTFVSISRKLDEKADLLASPLKKTEKELLDKLTDIENALRSEFSHNLALNNLRNRNIEDLRALYIKFELANTPEEKKIIESQIELCQKLRDSYTKQLGESGKRIEKLAEKHIKIKKKLVENAAKLAKRLEVVEKSRAFLRKIPARLTDARLIKGLRIAGEAGKVVGTTVGALLQIIPLWIDSYDFGISLNKWGQLLGEIVAKLPCEGKESEMNGLLVSAVAAAYASTLAGAKTLEAEFAALVLDVTNVPHAWLASLALDVYSWVVGAVNNKFTDWSRERIANDLSKIKCGGDECPRCGKNPCECKDNCPICGKKPCICPDKCPICCQDPCICEPYPIIHPIHDPSGYVYEGVSSNRLEGVTATCFYKETVEDMYGDKHENIVKWDATEYAQENPLFTDEYGMYAWDVPQGLWQVKFEKEGYETTYSEWLPVPPPQLDINIAMKQNVQPTVKSARAFEDAVEMEFDKYMMPELLTTDNIRVMVGETAVEGTVELLNEEVSYEGNEEKYASKVRFNATAPFDATEITLMVSNRVKSYAGIRMQDDFSQTFTIEPEVREIVCESNASVVYGNSGELTVQVLPAVASAGKTVKVKSSSSMILSTDVEELTLDSEGKASLTVNGELPGAAAITYSVDGYDLSATTMVSVEQEQLIPDSPVASVASGSALLKGSSVTLSCPTSSAVIYYTTDGSCPCDAGAMKYDGTPITISEATALKIMAVGKNGDESQVVTYTYTLRQTNLNIPLVKGWNWVSHNQDDALTSDKLEIDNVDRVLTQIGEIYRDPKLGFTGNIEDVNATDAFKVHTTDAGNLQLGGVMFNPYFSPVELRQGWNWLGYPLDKEITVEDAFSFMESEKDDIVTSLEDGYSQYDGEQWIGTLNTLIPGRGYMFKSASDKELAYNIFAAAALSANATNEIPSDDMSWKHDTHSYPNVMCVTADLYNKDVKVGAGEYLVGAFVDGECRGVGEYVGNTLFLSVHGDKNVEVTLLAMNTESGVVYDITEKIVFTQDVVGSVSMPYPLHLGSPTGISHITMDNSGVKSIHNILGQKVKSIDRSGVYIIDGKKVVVTKKNENDYSK